MTSSSSLVLMENLNGLYQDLQSPQVWDGGIRHREASSRAVKSQNFYPILQHVLSMQFLEVYSTKIIPTSHHLLSLHSCNVRFANVLTVKLEKLM